MSTFRAAEICLNGHVTTSLVDSMPQFREKYCSHCGEVTITKCPNCDSSIRGSYDDPDRLLLPKYIRPSYCNNCGKPFPWTERSLQAANELMASSGKFDEPELIQFKDDLVTLVKDTPQSQVASYRVRAFLLKAGKEITSIARDILVDMISETAKIAIWG